MIRFSPLRPLLDIHLRPLSPFPFFHQPKPILHSGLANEQQANEQKSINKCAIIYTSGKARERKKTSLPEPTLQKKERFHIYIPIFMQNWMKYISCTCWRQDTIFVKVSGSERCAARQGGKGWRSCIVVYKGPKHEDCYRSSTRGWSHLQPTDSLCERSLGLCRRPSAVGPPCSELFDE